MSFVADIDECREGSHLCDQFQNCINTFGAHECRCKNGFELDSSSGSCVGNNLSLRVTGFFFVTSRQVTSRSSEQKMKEWWKVLVAAQGRLLSCTMIVLRGYSGALNQNSHWSEFCYSSKLLATQTVWHTTSWSLARGLPCSVWEMIDSGLEWASGLCKLNMSKRGHIGETAIRCKYVMCPQSSHICYPAHCALTPFFVLECATRYPTALGRYTLK